MLSRVWIAVSCLLLTACASDSIGNPNSTRTDRPVEDQLVDRSVAQARDLAVVNPEQLAVGTPLASGRHSFVWVVAERTRGGRELTIEAVDSRSCIDSTAVEVHQSAEHVDIDVFAPVEDVRPIGSRPDPSVPCKWNGRRFTLVLDEPIGDRRLIMHHGPFESPADMRDMARGQQFRANESWTARHGIFPQQMYLTL